MNADTIYSYLIHAGWLFLAGWIVALILAFAVAMADTPGPARLIRPPQN